MRILFNRLATALEFVSNVFECFAQLLTRCKPEWNQNGTAKIVISELVKWAGAGPGGVGPRNAWETRKAAI